VIDNTSDRMKDPLEAMVFLAASMGPRGSDRAIEEQEAAGQRQLVNSDRLPTDLYSPREDFEALGFTFADPDPSDPMFMPATLPDGWKREGSDHAMWSYLLDGLGRRRASIFYKAAFYDRKAHMSLTTVSGYLRECVSNDQPVITDDAWATPQAVTKAARDAAQHAEEKRAFWVEHGDDKYATEYTAERDKYAAIASA
jgi:hypothetical protein